MVLLPCGPLASVRSDRPFRHAGDRAVRTWTAVALGALVVGLWSASPGRADLMLVPAGLHPGDQFRIAFLSSATRDARSADIADYDQFITNLAVVAGIDTYFGTPVTWQALASTPTVDAVDRLPRVAGSPPLYRLDGGLVAPSAGTLWVSGPGSFPITVTESGVDVGGEVIVWTGTLQDGTAFEPLGGGAFVTFGSARNISDSGWVSQNDAPRTEQHHLYGYSSVLTVPPAAFAAPTPGGLTLVLTGIGSLAGAAGCRAVRRKPTCA
ncbi:MAG TPA: hypothetical protein VGF55_18465 [Gemmataceae bacterium]|jgi:hypothetical protein